jgi:6-phosphogluconate dehydrogenase (decarboxylating)
MMGMFREWKRQGYEMVLEGLKHYSQTLNKEKRLYTSGLHSSAIKTSRGVAGASSRSPVMNNRNAPIGI